ncbi:MAG: glycosyltransferase [Candidatus Omnitrophica bacterium]|nr:glycosyltransferase [Candidatus Omnitrophota bacterium]
MQESQKIAQSAPTARPDIKISASCRKDPLMFSLILWLWFWAALYFTPRVLALVIGPEPAAAKCSIVVFALLLNFLGFYTMYHLVIIFFACRTRSAAPDRLLQNTETDQAQPRVALLYTTYNDFQEAAVQSCLKQRYDNFHTFILDDSTDPSFIQRVDTFAARYAERVTVIRRRERTGYKAGNINHAMRNISGYEYFSISDADTRLPPDYLTALLPYFQDERIAFAQANQALNPAQDSAFARHLGYQIRLHCDFYMKTKNRYGFVMFYGHGALLRTDVYRQVGGFPEIATEDLAYSLLVRLRGYEGIYASEVVCYEDFPPTYPQYRRRNEKWIRGTSQCLQRYFPAFARAREVSWMEKVDVLSAALLLLLPLPFVSLLLCVGVLLPLFYTHFRFQAAMFQMPLGFEQTPLKLILETNGNLFWRWDYFIFFLLSLVGSILPAIVGVFQEPAKKLRFIIMHSFMFYATGVVSAFQVIAYLVTGKAMFPVTGHRQDGVGGGCAGNAPVCRFSLRNYLSYPLANHPATVALELAAAVIFLNISLATQNIWFLSFAAGLGVSVFVLYTGYEQKALPWLAGIPVGFLLVIIWLIIRSIQ